MPALNGLDSDELVAHREHIRNDRVAAKARYDATVDWVEGFRAEISLPGGRKLEADEPISCGGSDKGYSPEDLLLSAVGSCLTVGWLNRLSRAGVTVRSLKIELSGSVDFGGALEVADVNPGFEGVEIVVHLDSDADPALVQEISESILPHSVIPETIMRAVPVTLRLAGADA